MPDPVRFGRYLLERRLAAGGMAEVFLGRAEGPKRFAKRVVVKRMLQALVDIEQYTEMFLDEARLAARFDHPNLIHVYELVETEGQYGLAMEYINGVDLKNVVDAGRDEGVPIPLDIAAYFVAESAAGLHYAHELRGEDGRALEVVHRDVSPANIVVTWNGAVKVVDFGIAKHSGRSTETARGIVKGKFSYMSPEQISEEDIDKRSDVFSLGAVMYELLSLERCFSQDTPVETLDAIRAGTFKPLAELRDDLPPELASLLDSMLVVDRDERMKSCGEIAQRLRRRQAGIDLPTPDDVGAYLRELFPKSEATNIVVSSVGSSDLVTTRDEQSVPSYAMQSDELAQLMARAHDTVISQKTSGTHPAVPLVVSGTVQVDASDLFAESEQSVSRTPTMRIGRPQPMVDTGTTKKGAPSNRAFQITMGLTGAALVLTLGIIIAVMARSRSGTVVVETPIQAIPASRNAVVFVSSNPGGAAVYLDGARLAGVTPLSLPELPVGSRHLLQVELAGYRPALQPFTIRSPSAGGQTEQLRLEPFRGPEPPVAAEPVEPAKPDSRDGPAKAAVKSKTAAPKPAVRAKTAPKPEAVAKVGTLSVTTSPAARIFLDGKALGPAPVKGVRLSPGRHEVRVINNDLGFARTASVQVRPGRGTQRHFEFKKGRVVLQVDPWADVYYRGKKLGTTPMAPISLYEGKQVLRLHNPDLGVEKTVRANVVADETLNVPVRLKKR